MEGWKGRRVEGWKVVKLPRVTAGGHYSVLQSLKHSSTVLLPPILAVRLHPQPSNLPTFHSSMSPFTALYAIVEAPHPVKERLLWK